MKFCTISDYVLYSRSCIQKGNYSKGLKIISNAADRIASNPYAISIANGSRELDEECMNIGLHWHKANNSLIRKQTNVKNNTPVYLYLVSRFQNSGGHSKIIQERIRSNRDAKHIILSSGISGRAPYKYIKDFFKLYNVYFDSCRYRCFERKLCWLYTQVSSLNIIEANILCDYNDSVIIALAATSVDINYRFYHHADHKFSLGLHCPQFRHIDTNIINYCICKQQCRPKLIEIEPLTIQDRRTSSPTINKDNTEIIRTSTIARSNKIENSYHADYAGMLPKILKATNGEHVHIGKLSLGYILKIRFLLLLANISQSRFKYIPWVPSVWDAFNDYSIDVLINSFPYGGALTCIEAMGAGIPVIYHDHQHSEVLSCIHVSYEKAFRWRYPYQLQEHLQKLNHKILREQSVLSRQHYEEYHSPKSIINHNQTIHKKLEYHYKNIVKSYQPNWCDWSYWTESQSKPSKQIYLYLKNILKKIVFHI